MITQSAMQSAVEGKVTVSDKIRALAAAGASRGEIADFLGRSYQQVRQVLVEDERRRGARPRSAGSAEAAVQQSHRTGVRAWDGPIRLSVDPEGRLVLPASALTTIGLEPASVAVVRLQDGELVLSNAERVMEKARALVRSMIPPDVSLADELLADRRREAGE